MAAGYRDPAFFGIATAIMIAALVMLPETKGRELATAFGEETGEQAQSGNPWMTSGWGLRRRPEVS